MITHLDVGVLYVAVGPNTAEYAREARRSAISLRKHNSDVVVALVVDQPGMVDPGIRKLFDHIITVPQLDVEDKMVLSKRINALKHTPFEHTLYLDCDTFICGDITDVFDMLNYYDMAMVYTLHRKWWRNLDIYGVDIPDWLPEFNGGIMVYKKSDIMHGLFADWQQLHIEMGEWNDQMALRATIWNYICHHALRIHVLPCEYGVWTSSPQVLGLLVRIIHGRVGLQHVCKRINEGIGHVRLWMPRPIGNLLNFDKFHGSYK